MPSSQNPIQTDIQTLLSPIAKYKLRSHQTSLNSHIPLLQSPTSPSPSIILLGDSTLERLITTCDSPSYDPWPSPTLLTDLQSRLSGVLNLGVGGDKIQNIGYRLLGDPARDLPGLLEIISQKDNVKLWVVHAGTNNLSPKNGLVDEDVDALEVIVRVLLMFGKESRVIVSGIMYRMDVEDGKVDEANEKLEEMVKRLNEGKLGDGRVKWLSPPRRVRKEEHLVDHVHLNLEGYRVWVGEVLFPGVLRLLEED
ncbi:SGNH hydrolase-type esterase domain-containing protein [Podospora fimiseda]|uniref:SGNH hydrolase-type esterase domain-containing protein n=1 Tax=Podospora fimiseda TaxID=252190 RepID=A0AAN6YMD2_9PEZI|nr:SGNH hydrolase-type esterase domain-containing protein [Podospora fimiseda]